MPAESVQSRILSSLQPIFKIADETFNPGDSGKYSLCLRVSMEGFSFAVLDSSRNKYIALQVFDLGKITGFEQTEEKLKELFSSLEFLNSPFKSVNAAFVHPHATLVPAAIYEEKSRHTYLGFNHPSEKTEIIFSDFIRLSDTWNVFSVPENIVKFLKNKFPTVRIHHYSSSLLTALPAQFKNSNDKKLAVHVQSACLDILQTEGGKLQYFNSFRYRSPEDFMYFLMFAIDRLKLNPETIEVSLLGEIEKNSVLFSLLNKYFRHIRFAERSETFQYSYGFTDVPSHFYYNLLNQLLCE